MHKKTYSEMYSFEVILGFVIAFLMPTNLQVWAYIFNEPPKKLWFDWLKFGLFLWERSHD
jgi:hypothetical protein